MTAVLETEAHTATGVASTSVTVTKPSGTVSGDYLLAFIWVESSPTVTPPSGWNLELSQNETTHGSGTGYVYSKTAGGSEPADYTWSWTGDSKSNGIVIRISGQDAVTPLNTITRDDAKPASTTQTSPTVTTTVDDCLIIRTLQQTRISCSPATPPGSHTERWDFTGPTDFDDTFGAGATIVQASAGATGTADWTISDSRPCVHFVVAIAPGAGPAVPPPPLRPWRAGHPPALPLLMGGRPLLKGVF